MSSPGKKHRNIHNHFKRLPDGSLSDLELLFSKGIVEKKEQPKLHVRAASCEKNSFDAHAKNAGFNSTQNCTLPYDIMIFAYMEMYVLQRADTMSHCRAFCFCVCTRKHVYTALVHGQCSSLACVDPLLFSSPP